MSYTSKLEEVIQKAWSEKDLQRAKNVISTHITDSRIKSKDIILENLEGIKSKVKLDFYLANSLLKFEKMSLNQ